MLKFLSHRSIFINDSSNDCSFNIIHEYMKKNARIALINRENKGLVFSLNEGIKKS